MKGGSDAQRRIVLSAIWWDAIAGWDSPFFCSQFLICQFFRWCFPSFSRDQLCTIQLQSRHVSEDGGEKHLRRPLTPTSTKQLGQWHLQSGKKNSQEFQKEKRDEEIGSTGSSTTGSLKKGGRNIKRWTNIQTSPLILRRFTKRKRTPRTTLIWYFFKNYNFLKYTGDEELPFAGGYKIARSHCILITNATYFEWKL